MSDDTDLKTTKYRVGDGTPGPGRPKGLPNKTTTLLKDAILLAAERAGNRIGSDGLVSYLEMQAAENPGPFMTLLGKVLPMQLLGAGDDGEHRHKLVIESRIVDMGAPK